MPFLPVKRAGGESTMSVLFAVDFSSFQRSFQEVVVRRRFISLLSLAVTAALVLPGSIRTHGQAQRSAPGIVALRGGTIVTVTKGTIQNGVVVMRDGKIAAVGGATTSIPAGAEVIDVTGKFISPGIIDAHSHMANDSINEGGTTVSSMTGI